MAGDVAQKVRAIATIVDDSPKMVTLPVEISGEHSTIVVALLEIPGATPTMVAAWAS
jgi:hypothetical protein